MILYYKHSLLCKVQYNYIDNITYLFLESLCMFPFLSTLFYIYFYSLSLTLLILFLYFYAASLTAYILYYFAIHEGTGNKEIMLSFLYITRIFTKVGNIYRISHYQIFYTFRALYISLI